MNLYCAMYRHRFSPPLGSASAVGGLIDNDNVAGRVMELRCLFAMRNLSWYPESS